MATRPQFTAKMRYVRNVLTSFFASLSALIFSRIMLNAYYSAYEYNEIDFQAYEAKAFLVILFPIVIIGTVFLIFNYSDNLDLFNKREYFDSRDSRPAGKPLIAEYPYLIGFAINMLFATPVFTVGYDMMLLFFFPNIDVIVARALAVLTMAGLRLFQLWDLRDKWEAEIENPLFIEKTLFKRNQDMYAFKAKQMILQPIGYFIVFSIVANVFGFFGFPMLMVVFMIILSPDMWWALFSIPVIIILVMLAVRLIHNTRKRLILLKKLKSMEKEGLAKVKYKGSKILSATFIRIPFSVEITTWQGEVYNALVVTSGKINAPMYFKSDEYMVEHGFHLRGGGLLAKGGTFGQVVDISSWGGKENPSNLIFGFRTAHKLNFKESEGERIVILNPTPTTAYAVNGREYRPIDTGEDMTNYTIYTATGLFNHIERKNRKSRFDD